MPALESPSSTHDGRVAPLATFASITARDPALFSSLNLRSLQRSVGNRAVMHLLSVQRQGDEPPKPVPDAAALKREAAKAKREAAKAERAAKLAAAKAEQEAKEARARAFRDSIAVEMSGATGGPYADFEAFKKTLKPTTFLGHSITNGVRQEFADKLKIAEGKINDEFTNASPPKPIPAKYGIDGITGFRDEVSQHGWGLAIDLDAGKNPYLMHQLGNAAVDLEVGPVYTNIATLLLNDPIEGHQSIIPVLITKGKNLPATSQATRAERLGQYWDRLTRESNAMKRYFALMKDATALRAFLDAEWSTIHPNEAAPDSDKLVKQMWQDFAALGGAIPKAGPPGVKGFKTPAVRNRPFHPINRAQKDPGEGFLTIPREVAVGLGQAVGRWGPIDFGGESGDVMHFDDRNGLGKPFDAAKDAAIAKAEKAAAEKKAAADKAAAQAGGATTPATGTAPAPTPAPATPAPKPAPPAQRQVAAPAGGVTPARPVVARSPERSTYPWLGRIARTSTAAMRSTPAKSEDDPHANTLADLPRGTQVRVVTAKGGWLRVEATVGGEVREGYVSQELVAYVGSSAFEVPPITITVDLPSTREAFLELKRAETTKASGAWQPSADETDRLELCASVLEGTGKYVVDTATWQVDFKRTPGQKTNVYTIEDFILFVENVEREYPSAMPMEIASEIRETWFADPKWGVLVASQGIRDGGKLLDIETQGPIPKRFDMKQIAPNQKNGKEGGLTIATPMGVVDVSHVLAGIDATLSGGMAGSYPERFLEEREKQTGDDYDTFEVTEIYDLLKEASGGGDTRSFATWAGDLGQAYAEFILDRYIKKNATTTLAAWAELKSPRDQILGDIQGYVAVKMSRGVSKTESPTGERQKVSDILRNMYMVPKQGAGTFKEAFATASKLKPAEVAADIERQALLFGRQWFARGLWAHRDPWTIRPEVIIRRYADKFDDLHAAHKQNGAAEDQLQVMIDQLLKELDAKVW